MTGSASITTCYLDIDFHGTKYTSVESAVQAFFDDRLTDTPVCPISSCKYNLFSIVTTENLSYILVLDVEWNLIWPIPSPQITFQVNNVQYTYQLVGQINWTRHPRHFTANFVVGAQWYAYNDMSGYIEKVNCLQKVVPPMKPNSYWYRLVHRI